MSPALNSPVSTPAVQPPPTVDLAALKARQQVMWASGDFAVIGNTLQLVGESLCEAVDLEAGTRVLDVACGNGNAALAAAHRWCKVTGLDYVPSLLEQGRARAAAEQLSVEFVEGDAERLPFDDRSFDVGLSTFGVMFAPDQARAAQELRRVVRPGGKLGLASWTPEGFVGQMLKAVAKYVPPVAGVASPIGWGTEARLGELFAGVKAVRSVRRHFAFRYESPAHFVEVFRKFYGPTFKAFAALDADGKQRLAADLMELCIRFNRQPSSLVAPGEYLETIIDL